MSNVSADLAWLLTRRSNKYIQKRGTIRLSNDPFNNTGKSTKRHAGYIQAKGAVVRVKGEKEIQVYIKDGSNANKPAKQWVKKSTGAKASDASKAVAAVRPDLADVAFRRAAKLQAAIKNAATVRSARKALTTARKANEKRKFKRAATRTKKAKKN